MSQPDLSRILNELGEDRGQFYGAVSPPVFQTSNFCFPSIQKMRDSLQDEFGTPFYTRGHNPTVAVLRKKVAALCGAEDALVFGSGSAAIAAAIFSSVQAGDHVVAVKNPYSWTNALLNKMLSRYGVTASMIDGTDPANLEAAIRPNTRLFVLESPNSMTFELQDLRAVAAIAKKHGITTTIDNSYSSPLYQKPIEMGIDIEVHTASKYLGGHSDIVGGVLCSSEARIRRIFDSEFMTLGGVISPHDAWLIIRGLRTLHIRLERVAESTEKVAAFLASHPKVGRLIYPHHPSHPQYDLALRQMKKAPGLISLHLKAEEIGQADRFCDALQRFLLACSWGGYESLVYPACVLYGSQNYSGTTLPWNHVRLYIGLEDPEVLIADLEQALAVI